MTTQRNTTQKIKILEFLRSVKTHPSAEDVYKAVKEDLPTISLGTVYRNLNLLAEQGEILKLELGGEFRFDGDICHHVHYICQECGIIVDESNGPLSKIVMDKIKSKSFKPKCVNILVKGYCKECKGGK